MSCSFIEFLEQGGPLGTQVGKVIKERLVGPSQVKKGTVLLKEGEVNDAVYFIEQGMARFFYTVRKKQITNRFVPEHHLAVSYHSYFTQEPSYESLDILTNSTVYALHRKDLEELISCFPGLLIPIRYQLAQALIASDERTMMIRKLSATERYNTLLKKYPSIFLNASVDHIASFLGITRETLSRIRSASKCDIYHKN